MREVSWYYVDRSQQRIGPVAPSDVAEAHRVGAIDDQSLVWREGLASWLPLGQFRGELGIIGPPTVLPPQPQAQGPAPAGSGSRTAAWVLGLLALGVGGIFVLAVLAAIALPAYQDYVSRSQVTSALADIRVGVTPYEEAIAGGSGNPATLAALGLPDRTARCSEVFVEGSFADAGSGHLIGCIVAGTPAVDGAVLTLERQAQGNWTCRVAGLRDRHLPSGCENE
ncbi:pilin [Arenimonas composti]|uniref:GYF domain-containing protein n=1 Tax=Arenimonas composti TR7-09 = DSM 18010 TaxID=1121013 RepID=A0A091BED5_9GAMM|nr:pilin [Arenimonas composti]KFN49887.1 hypothetical protein P873_08570 [Arenimonas composti TR7-09 = DSM 18010]